MTIIAGFKSVEGIVVCADTQETISNISKRNVPKVRFEPSEIREHILLAGVSDLAVAFCGAASNGPFIDKIVDRAWEVAQLTTSLDDASMAIENSIKQTYQEFGQIYQPGYCPEAELIYGIKMHGKSRLFSALGPIINERDTYSTGGAGYYMADFLASRMYNGLLNIYQCAILAAYILFQAKEHVDGCGGESQIAVLRNNGTSGLAASANVEKITKLVQWGDQAAGDIIIQMADLDLSKEKFKEEGIQILAALAHLREKQRNTETFGSLDLLGGLKNRDALGLLKPEKEEDHKE